jgi:hypothetical protein
MVRQDLPTPPPPTTTSLYSLRNYGLEHMSAQCYGVGLAHRSGLGTTFDAIERVSSTDYRVIEEPVRLLQALKVRGSREVGCGAGAGRREERAREWRQWMYLQAGADSERPWLDRAASATEFWRAWCVFVKEEKEECRYGVWGWGEDKDAGLGV